MGVGVSLGSALAPLHRRHGNFHAIFRNRRHRQRRRSDPKLFAQFGVDPSENFPVLLQKPADVLAPLADAARPESCTTRRSCPQCCAARQDRAYLLRAKCLRRKEYRIRRRGTARPPYSSRFSPSCATRRRRRLLLPRRYVECRCVRTSRTSARVRRWWFRDCRTSRQFCRESG